MRRALVFISIFLPMLVTARGVSAAPQSKRSSTLSGVVLGPDDRPVAHASVSYQSSGGAAPHVVRTDSSGHHPAAVRGDEELDAAFGLRKGNSEGLRKAESQTVRFFPLESIAGEIFYTPLRRNPRSEPQRRDSDFLLIDELGELVQIGGRDVRNGAEFHPLMTPVNPLITLAGTWRMNGCVRLFSGQDKNVNEVLAA